MFLSFSTRSRQRFGLLLWGLFWVWGGGGLLSLGVPTVAAHEAMTVSPDTVRLLAVGAQQALTVLGGWRMALWKTSRLAVGPSTRRALRPWPP